MQRVSWRYNEPKSSAISRQPEMAFVPNATRGAEVLPRACRSKTNERSPCPGVVVSHVWARVLRPQLAQQQRPLSPSTIYRALRRVGLGTRHERLLLLERHSAERSELLTERTRRRLQRARRQRRHVQASEPGELVCLDTFYIGRLKGVGKVWQITAYDAACSYAVARIIPACTSDHAVRFPRRLPAAVLRGRRMAAPAGPHGPRQ